MAVGTSAMFDAIVEKLGECDNRATDDEGGPAGHCDPAERVGEPA